MLQEVIEKGNKKLKILVRSPNWLGDHVLAFPFYQNLRALFPQAAITLYSPKTFTEILPPKCFDTFISTPREKNFSSFWDQIKILKNEKFDWAFSLPSSTRIALEFFLSRIPKRWGFAEPSAKIFLNHSLSWKANARALHKSDYYLELLPTQSRLQTSKKTTPNQRKKWVLVAPQASIALREWPYYIDLIRLIAKTYSSYQVKILGTLDNDRWQEKLKDLAPNVENLIGKTSVTELVALCKQAALVIVNDSGIAHIASQVAEAPTLVLMGPGDPAYIRPLGPTTRILRNTSLPCSPCESAKCRGKYGYQTCLKSITVESVLEEANAMLKALPT